MTRRATFITLAGILAGLFVGAGAPTPLYIVYQERYGFSALVLTVVFAVYVLALLAALLVAGRLSDELGRRPVLAVALVVQLVSMALFVLADGTGWLLAARAVQGLATGLGASTLSAALLDTQPSRSSGMGAMVSAAAPLAGLAAGALGAAILVQFGPDPIHLVFWVLIVGYAGALVLVAIIPEPLPRRGDRAVSLRPRVAVPRPLRATFAAIAPSIMATWALGGLYLSLGPSLTAELTGSVSHVVAGLVVVALMGTSAVSIVLTRHRAPSALMLGGTVLLIAGVAVTLVAVAARSTVLLFAGSAISGLGFGPAFAGAFRTLTGLAEPQERAALISAIYVVAYSAFSVPAILAGVAETSYGLRSTALVYAAIVIAFAALAAAAYGVQLRRARAFS